MNLDSALPIPYSTSAVTYSSYLQQGTYNSSLLARPFTLISSDYYERLSYSFTYVPITPYKIPIPTLDTIQNYLPQYYITVKNSATPSADPKTYCLYDLNLLDRYSDTDPTIDARYQGGLNITYTRSFDGKTYTHTVPVTIDQRSCPAYMMQ
jgi:hypothetical protein